MYSFKGIFGDKKIWKKKSINFESKFGFLRSRCQVSGSRANGLLGGRLACQGCRNKVPQTRWVKQQEVISSRGCGWWSWCCPRPLSWACRCHLLLSPHQHGLLWVCVCAPTPLSDKDISQTELRPSQWPHFNLFTYLKVVSPSTVTFWGTGGLGLQRISLRPRACGTQNSAHYKKECLQVSMCFSSGTLAYGWSKGSAPLGFPNDHLTLARFHSSLCC